MHLVRRPGTRAPWISVSVGYFVWWSWCLCIARFIFLFSLITISLASWSWICCNEFGAGCRFHDLSCRTGFGAPLLDMINGSGSGSCNRVDFLNLRFYHFHFHMCFAPQHRAFLNISTSKSAPTLKCFQHVCFQMCFAPQRRALFRHPRCQNCSGTFWLPNLLHARTASQRRAIFHLSSGQMAPHLRLWRAYFSTLRSHKALGKHSVSRLFYLFARLDLLSSDFLWACVFCLFSLTLATCPYCRNFEF